LGHPILFPFPEEWCSADPAEMSDVLLPHPWSKSLRKKQAALAGEALSWKRSRVTFNVLL